MEVGRFRKKPVVIEAVRLTRENVDEVVKWVTEHGGECWPGGRSGMGPGKKVWVRINTLEGEHLGSEGDWIIRGVAGEFYPCKPDIFEATYELAAAEDEPFACGVCGAAKSDFAEPCPSCGKYDRPPEGIGS